MTFTNADVEDQLIRYVDDVIKYLDLNIFNTFQLIKMLVQVSCFVCHCFYPLIILRVLSKSLCGPTVEWQSSVTRFDDIPLVHL